MKAKDFNHNKVLRISEYNTSGIFKVRVPARTATGYEIVSVTGTKEDYEEIKLKI